MVLRPFSRLLFRSWDCTSCLFNLLSSAAEKSLPILYSINSICVPVSVSQNLPCWREWRTAKLEGSSRSRWFWRFLLTLNLFKLVQIVTSHGNSAADPQLREAQCWRNNSPFCKCYHTIIISIICTLISWAKRSFICPFEFKMIEKKYILISAKRWNYFVLLQYASKILNK